MAADGKVEIDVILNDKDVAKGVSGVDKSLSGIKASGERASVGIGKVVGALGLVYAAKKGIDMVAGSVQKAFGRIDTMEQFERVMTTMTGSAEKAGQVLDNVNDTVTGTAYGLDVGAKAVQGFVTSNMDVDKATMTFEAWGDAVAFYGDGTNDTLGSVTDALAKATAKGKIQMDTMNTLAESGIPAMQIYADATGQSVEDVADAMSKGKIDAESFTDVMNDAMKNGTKGFESIDGAAKEAGASWAGSFDNMKAAVTRGTMSIIQNIDDMLSDNGLPSMREMIAEFGKTFERALKKVADYIPIVVDQIKSIYNSLEPWIPLIKAVALGVTVFITAFAGINSLINIFNMVRNAIVLVNLALMANPIVLIIAAIAAAAALIYVYWEPISEFFIALWASIKESGLAIWDALKSAWSKYVEWVKGIWTPVLDFFLILWKGITETALKVWDSVKKAWNSAVDNVTQKWESVKSFFVDLWDGISTKATDAWDSIIDKVTNVYNNIISIFSPAINFYSNLFGRILEVGSVVFENLSTFLSNTWENIKSIAGSAWEIIKNLILGPVLLLIDLITGDFEGFKENLAAIWENISSAASKIWESIKNIATDYVEALVSNILALWDAFKLTISEYLTAIKETFLNVWSAIVDFVVDRFNTLVKNITNAWENIKKVFSNSLNAVKTYVTQGFENLKNSATQKINSLRDGMRNAWENIKNTFSNALERIKSTVSNKFNDLKNSASNKMTEVRENIVNVWDRVMSFFRNIDLSQMGKDAIQGFINGITSKIKAVGDAAKKAADAVTGKIKSILKIASPSKLLFQYGGWTGEGFAGGVEDMEGYVEDASEKLAKAAIPDVSRLGNLRGIKAESVINGLHPRSLQNKESVINEFTNNNGYDDQRVIRLLKELVAKDGNVYLGEREVGEVGDKEQAKRTKLVGRRVAY